jgi:predicted XRE-type DNA-binding protein
MPDSRRSTSIWVWMNAPQNGGGLGAVSDQWRCHKETHDARFSMQLGLAFIPELVCHLIMGKHSHHYGLDLQVFEVEKLGGRTKLGLAEAINQSIREQRLSQAQASAMLGMPQPKISALANYHLDGFSVQRLLRILNALGRDVVIQVNKKKKPGSIGKTSVAAA